MSTNPATGSSTSPSSLDEESRLSAYEQLGIIGEGTFGKVHKVKRKEDGEILVYKELYYGSMGEKEKQQLVDEVNILRDLNHRNIVKYYDRIILRAKKKIFIVMEFCANGDLATIIKKHIKAGTFIEEDMIWKVLYEVGTALRDCHCKEKGKILHRDLKPGNIFLDGNNTVKLGDFGLARILKNASDYARTHVGTPYYMSPEQVEEKKYNEKSDMWSLGCLVYELAAKAPPFQANTPLQLAERIKRGYFPRIPTCYSNELDNVIRMMLQVAPEKRPSILELLNQPRLVLEKENQRITYIKKSYEDMRKKTQEEITKKWEELKQREMMLDVREKRLKEKEISLEKKEKELYLREREQHLNFQLNAGVGGSDHVAHAANTNTNNNNNNNNNTASSTNTTTAVNNLANPLTAALAAVSLATAYPLTNNNNNNNNNGNNNGNNNNNNNNNINPSSGNVTTANNTNNGTAYSLTSLPSSLSTISAYTAASNNTTSTALPSSSNISTSTSTSTSTTTNRIPLTNLYPTSYLPYSQYSTVSSTTNPTTLPTSASTLSGPTGTGPSTASSLEKVFFERQDSLTNVNLTSNSNTTVSTVASARPILHHKRLSGNYTGLYSNANGNTNANANLTEKENHYLNSRLNM